MKIIDDPILSGRICPYCGKETLLTDSSEVYGVSYGPIYLCRDCNAFVGCYTGTTISLGRLANAELREAKKRAHHYLDQLWISGRHSRHSIYTWLSNQLGIPRELTHIGMSDIEQCNKIAEISKARLDHEEIEYYLWSRDEEKGAATMEADN